MPYTARVSDEGFENPTISEFCHFDRLAFALRGEIARPKREQVRAGSQTLTSWIPMESLAVVESSVWHIAYLHTVGSFFPARRAGTKQLQDYMGGRE